MPREIKPPSRYVTEDGLLPQLASRVSTPQTSAKKGKPSRGSSSAPTPRSTRIPMGRNVNDSIVIGDDDDSDVEIVEPPTRFLKRKRDEDKDPDWGTSRKMAKSSKPLDRSGARAPSSRTPHPSHSRAVPPSKTPQTASTRTPQAPGSRTPQTQGSRTPQIPGSRTPQTHGSRTPQTQGSRTTPQTTGSRTPQTTGSRTPQVPGSKTPQTSVKTSHMPLWKTPQSSTSKAATPSRTAQATRTSQSSKVPPNRTPQYSRTPHPSALQSQLQASQRAQPRSAPAGGYKTASAWKQQRSPAPNSISKQGQDKVASSHVDLHMECYEEALSTVQVQTAKREQLAYEKSQMLIRAAQEGRLLFTPTGDPKVLKKPYQPPKHVKTPTPPPSQLLPIPAPVPLISPPQATSLLSVAAYQGAPHVVSGGMPEFSSLLSGVTTSVGMPGLMPTSVFAPVLGTYGLGVRLPPWQAIPPPPPLSPPPAPAPPKPTANQAQKKGGQQKGKNSSLYSTNMSRTQAEVLALLRSKKKKEDSKKTPPKAKRAEADMQKTKEKPRKRKTKDVEKEVPRQNTPDEGGKAKSIAEPPKRNRERKQTHQEMDETSGNWVPLGEYYYGKMEGDPTYKETKGDFRFKCWYCNKILLSNVAAMLHIQGHIDSEKQVNLDLNDLTSCKHCYKNFNTPFEMQTHIEKVHSNKANVLLCRICEKDHDSHHALREHMKRNHNACEMPYTCQLCKFRSSMYSDVVDHFKKKHSNTSSLLCLYCLKTLTVRSNNQGWGQTLNYYNHVLKHQIKNCTKKCSLCKLVFHSASTLKAHRQTDHLPNQRGVMATRSKQKASDEVMIKIAGDLGGASSGTGRSSRTLGGGGGGGAGGWASPSVSGVRSLNVPAVKKFVEHHVIIPAQAQKAKCVECDKTMGKPEHYKKYMQCSMCRYASSCTLAYNNHMLGFHSGQEAAVAALHIPTDRPMMKELYCECGFSSPYGNKLANHLVSCSKSSCYKTPPPPPSGDNFGTELQDPRKKPDACLLDVLGLVKKDSLALYISRNMRPETPPQEPVEMPEVDEVSRPARRPSLLMGAKKSSKPASLKDKADPVKPDKDSEPLPTSGKSAGDMEKVHIKMEAESYSGGEKPNKKEVKIVEKTGDASEEKIEERKQELQDEKKEDEDLMESCESRRKSEKVADKVQGLTENVEELKEGSKEEFKEKEEQDDESRAMKNEQNALKENIKEEKPSDGEEKEGSTEFSSIIKERSGPELGSSTQVDAPAVTGATTSDKAGVLKSSLVDYNSESDEEDSDNIPEVGETEVLKPTEPEETVGSDKENGELRASIVETRESGEDSRATIEGDEGKSGEADVKEAEQRENVEMEEGSGIEDESRDNEGEEPEAGESTHKGADVGAAMDKRGAETRGQTDEDIDSQLSADQELNTSLEQAVPSDEDGESKDTRTSVGEPAMEEENTADTADSNVVGGDGGADPKLGEEDSTTGTDFADEGTRITNEDDSESSSLKAPEVDTGEENGTADRQVSPKQSQSFNHNFVPGLNSLGEGSCDAKDWTGRFPHAESTNDEAIGDKGDGPSLAGALSERVFEHTSGEQRKMTEELERSSDIDSDSQTKSEVKAPTLNIGEGSVISSEEEDKKEEEEEEMDINLGEIGRGGEKSLDADSLDRSTTQGIEWPAESQEASDIQRETTQNKNEEENFNEVDERDNHSQQESNTESMQDASSQGVLLPQNIPESASLEEAHENSTIDKEKSMEAEEEDMPLQTQAVHEEDTHKDLNLQDSEAVREEMSASVSASETPKDSDADHESRKSFSWGSGAEGFVPQPTSSTTVEQSSVRPSTSHSSAYSGEGHRDRSRSRERRRSRSRDKRSRSRDRRSRSRSRDRQRERDRDRRRERDRHHRDRDRDRHHDRDRDRHRDRRDRSRDRDRRDRSRDRDRDRRDRSRERDRERDRDRDRERDRDYYKHRDDRRHR